MKNLLIIAAENSAENYGAQIVEQFKIHQDSIHFFGVGGEKLARKNVEIIIPNQELSIVGIIEIITKIWKLKRYAKLLVQTAEKKKADAALLIDYPDFNLRLAKKLKKRGIPVYYYISPTVWAWRYSRVNLIKKFVRHIFIIFPFEIDIFQRERIPFTYTGHPLIPMIQVKENKHIFRKKHQINQRKTMITLLPGSRKSEVKRLLPEMLQAMILLKADTDLHVFILKADNIEEKEISDIIQKKGVKAQIMNQKQGHNLINASDIVVSTCGTSNLEIALLGVPFIATYIVNQLSYVLGKGLVKIKLYSIVNIMAGKQVIPELIQQNCRAEKIVKEVKSILGDQEIKKKMLEEFSIIKQKLKQKRDPSEIIFSKISQDLHV